MKHDVNTDPELAGDDREWAALLSKAARRDERDDNATLGVLQALKLEREGIADGTPWAQYLTQAARLEPADDRVVQQALQAVHLERRRVVRWRTGVTRWVAGIAAAAAIAVSVTVASLPGNAPASDAYNAYQEAVQGW